jgi:hypothetical protein
MEAIIKTDSNGNRLSLEIVNGKMRVAIADNEIGMSVDLDANESENLIKCIAGNQLAEPAYLSGPVISQRPINTKMVEIIAFTQTDGDPFLNVEIPYNFQLGDIVYYSLTEEELNALKNIYPHMDCEGIISDKWIDLSNMRILWTVNIDFEIVPRSDF